MKRTAYVAGKVTGLPKTEVKSKFNLIEHQLAGMGYHVVKPIRVNEDDTVWKDAVSNDIRKMLECDEVHLLPDGQDSRGAQLERDIALRLGMPIVYH